MQVPNESQKGEDIHSSLENWVTETYFFWWMECEFSTIE